MLEATGPPDGTTRYVDQVVTFAPDDITFEYLSPKRLVFGRVDVIHFHWPEVLVRHTSPLVAAARCVLLLGVILWLKMARIAIVRTIHNLEPHEGGGRLEKFALARLDRATNHWVTINEVTIAPGKSSSYIPHGHYRDRFSGVHQQSAENGRLTYAGLVRPYKGVDRLIESFRRLCDPELTLRIVGRATPALSQVIERAVRDDPRISARLEFVPDRDLVEEITRAELVCLPYEEMHNSGMLLVALSLDRPVLVPSSPTTEALADEVGPGWVRRFEGHLTSEKLGAALASVRRSAAEERPRLEARDWDDVARAYAAVFRHAAGTKKSQ